jgi:hypothetical protein
MVVDFDTAAYSINDHAPGMVVDFDTAAYSINDHAPGMAVDFDTAAYSINDHAPGMVVDSIAIVHLALYHTQQREERLQSRGGL